ncbi:guanylate cyclase, putative [Pediculus humanus corporis]|uniref:guanylate cyclase n=1 Tax=Pediculus humanus subsp. corporis TaxID=121224 RepID=E0W4J6_PEDHC|nr:guanylate cyclase, putative [Pediculus humanus corporis]EEB20552.1 guanylate cyclase, putative [Pediculus humanus corporis]
MGVGEKLHFVLGDVNPLGENVTNLLKLRRPRGITFIWKNILYLQSVLFELEIISRSCKTSRNSEQRTQSDESLALVEKKGSHHHHHQNLKSILLKGQMFYLKDIKSVIFLCSPLKFFLLQIYFSTDASVITKRKI